MQKIQCFIQGFSVENEIEMLFTKKDFWPLKCLMQFTYNNRLIIIEHAIKLLILSYSKTTLLIYGWLILPVNQ